MTNTEALADRLLQMAKANGGLRQLSRDSGIAYSTLRAQLIYEPSRLTAVNVFAITSALNVELAEVVAS
jgi:DNA-binding phage protein